MFANCFIIYEYISTQIYTVQEEPKIVTKSKAHVQNETLFQIITQDTDSQTEGLLVIKMNNFLRLEVNNTMTYMLMSLIIILSISGQVS